MGGLISRVPVLTPSFGTHYRGYPPSPAEPPGTIFAAGRSAGERVPTIVGVGVRSDASPQNSLRRALGPADYPVGHPRTPSFTPGVRPSVLETISTLLK